MVAPVTRSPVDAAAAEQATFLQKKAEILIDEVKRGIEALGGTFVQGQYNATGAHGAGMYLKVFHNRFKELDATGEIELYYLDKDCREPKDFLDNMNCDLTVVNFWLQDKLPSDFPIAIVWPANSLCYRVHNTSVSLPLREFFTPPSTEKPDGEFNFDQFYALYQKAVASAGTTRGSAIDVTKRAEGKGSSTLSIDPRKVL